MRYLYALFLLGFAAVAVLSIFGMHSGMETHRDTCLAATVQGAACPEENSEYVSFHLNTFKEFSRATIGTNSLFVSAVVLLIGIATAFRSDFSGLSTRIAFFLVPRARFSIPSLEKITHWLALHENSPAIS